MANIREIAKLAGVSPSTVSRVLNNSGYVSWETRKKVQAVMEKLDYVPNLNAVSLKKGATKLIGIAAPYLGDEINTFLGNFAQAAQEKGYNITLFLTNADPKKERDALESLRRRQIDALAVVIRANDWDTIAQYSKYGPIVTWQRVIMKEIPSVFMDQYEGYMLGLEHLHAKGYRKISNVYGNPGHLNTIGRMEAFRDFCRKYCLNEHALPHFYHKGSIRDGEEMAHWWKNTADKPDAFMAPNDRFAAGLVSEAKRLGLNVPGDFAVCGFDNTDIARLLDITTINYPIGGQARNAFSIIQNRLEGKTIPLTGLKFELIERKTT
ncbi:LacI family transcriptional regulator [Weizmannia acidilactici]|uniref:LacI family transcriptional regulator n=1 Tax=Weizmannia acidilactici TaxID=2607726 RepID=A0A5J4JAD5_9BACI|nr:LacI family DNA-binding transcriptional regulator [Weizmannia acidilactici]GER66589.1 LacI family transcriptional regulator [Weizmannia acidilactici]GER68863.1 LacI family transcriptional regulator [Weizmannia acidilactici]GER73488.1 LacI family transcriptional regulator [Weizmannia acidilactici]